MTPFHSHAFREWESDVNDIQSNFEESRETSFKKFIMSIKTKMVFSFKPVGPFMEEKDRKSHLRRIRIKTKIKTNDRR